MAFREVGRFGGFSPLPGSLRGIAADEGGLLYAAGNSGLRIINGRGSVLRQWPTARAAHSVAVGHDGLIYAGEEQQVEIFDATGKRIHLWRDPILFGRVTAIGLVGDGVLAGDAAERTIRHLDRAGRLRNNIGDRNSLNGFHIPNGVVAFSVFEGIVYAANPGKHRVEKYNPNGEMIGHIGRFDALNPAGFTGCCNPVNIAVQGGRIFTVEKAGPRVKALNPDGALLEVIAAHELDPNCKNMYVCAGPHRVYVADTVKNQVLVFEESAR